MGRGTLRPEQILRVRALDWETPVLSAFRCELWKSARKRFESSPPALGSAEKNSDAMPIVLDAILKLDGKVTLEASSGKILVLRQATPTKVAALKKALNDDKLGSASCDTDGFCELDMVGLGNQIDALINQIKESASRRQTLLKTRDRRLCEVTKSVTPADDRFDREDLPIRFNNRPALPKFSCQ
jgi:hypothetical protein